MKDVPWANSAKHDLCQYNSFLTTPCL